MLVKLEMGLIRDCQSYLQFQLLWQVSQIASCRSSAPHHPAISCQKLEPLDREGFVSSVASLPPRIMFLGRKSLGLETDVL